MSADRAERPAGGISGEELSEQEMIAWARERARDSAGSPGGYDGYGGLESDLEEILVREFGEIRRKLPPRKSARLLLRNDSVWRRPGKLTEGNTGPPDRNSGSADSICWWTATM